MRRLASTLLLASLILALTHTASATSWREVKPQEVVDRAEVIVTGKYDFSSTPKPSKFIFQGLDFNVTNVYRGDVPKQITAGIDFADASWAKKFQDKGGEFVLFLEKSDDVDFLVPVGGPYGMIKVINGKVEDFYDERRIVFFEDFLKAEPKEPSDTQLEATNKDTQNDDFLTLLYVGVGVIAGIVAFILLQRYRRK